MTEMNQKEPLNVLFLGGSNSVRSIMAEAILNHEGMGRFRAFSAGREPSGKVHPCALDLLSKLNFDISKLHSKSWSEFAGAGALPLDLVFTVCDSIADMPCPNWPGDPMTGNWALPDPSLAKGKDPEIRLAFADAFRMLNNRVVILASLPVRSLDKSSLRRQLELIAKRKDAFKSAAAAA